MVEILAPCGNLNSLISAVNAGADAVYLGLADFSARKNAQNFNLDELKYAVSYAKTFNVKVYLTLNTLIKDSELNSFFTTIGKALNLGVDAIILQDILLGKVIKNIFPNAVLHLSTQAGVCNTYGAKLAVKYGFSRVILARETSLEDIKNISKIVETEVFVQGALCTSFSGHCYLSSFVGGNSGNRGLCKQPCRKKCSYYVNDNKITTGYSLSLADLSVGESIAKLSALGVKSFKIEGRMRGDEYVCSSILYYKSLLNGKPCKEYFNLMKIAFNRGDYTKGLAFSQDKNFISNKIQSNQGLFIGKVESVQDGNIKISTNYQINAGDSFKIIDNGVEVANATCTQVNNQLHITYKGKVKVGNRVNLTKCANLISNLNIKSKLRKISVKVYVSINDNLKFIVGDKIFESNYIVQAGKTSFVKKMDVIKCLKKVDKYPFLVDVNFVEFDDNAFIPVGVLNNLRSALYEELFYIKTDKINYNIEKYTTFSNLEKLNNKGENCAIVNSFVNTNCTNIIYSPSDYNQIDLSIINSYKNKKVWLYLPPYASDKDLEIALKYASKFYGIYGDGYYALEFANEIGKPLFAGVGFNVFNKIDVSILLSEGVEYISASKELSLGEIRNISNSLYVLSTGNLQIMDLIYCPFSKNCKNCSYKDSVVLKDEDNREYLLYRYKMSDCRFKLFNNHKLIFDNVEGFNEIFDYTSFDSDLIFQIESSNNIENIKKTFKNFTYGNYKKGTLWLKIKL